MLQPSCRQPPVNLKPVDQHTPAKFGYRQSALSDELIYHPLARSEVRRSLAPRKPPLHERIFVVHGNPFSNRIQPYHLKQSLFVIDVKSTAAMTYVN
jgi:hypothetical protein